MRRVMIFGAGIGGQRVRRALPKGDQLVGFLDNNPAKHGDTLAGAPIHAPDHLRQAADWDAVIVASAYEREICCQLHELGIPRERIELVDWDQLGGVHEVLPQTPAPQVLWACGALGAVALFLLARLL